MRMSWRPFLPTSLPLSAGAELYPLWADVPQYDWLNLNPAPVENYPYFHHMILQMHVGIERSTAPMSSVTD
jgi:hypothetical protein